MADGPWRVQWHIAPDGRVVRQRSKGDGDHQQLFQHHASRCPLSLADLAALDERLATIQGKVARKTVPLLAAAWLGLAAGGVGVVLGLLGLPPGYVLAGIGVVVTVAAMSASGVVMGQNVRQHQDAWHEAGFESHNGVTMSAREARALINGPGTQSGPIEHRKLPDAAS